MRVSAAFVLTASLAAQAVPIIDLVATPANPGRARLIETRVGGRAFQNPEPVPHLPLDIELESLTSSRENPAVKIVLIRVRNIGAVPYRLPVGRDGDCSLQPGNRDRHELWFQLYAVGEPNPWLFGQPTFSSADVPGSTRTLPVGGVVEVRFRVNLTGLTNARQWKRAGRAVKVKARCEDHPYADDPHKYSLHAPLPDALSRNELTLPVD